MPARQRRSPKLVALLALAAAPSLLAGGEASLEEWLGRLARTAEVYRARALGFSCTETMRWDGADRRGRRRFGYVVVQAAEGGLEDYRTPLRGRGERVEPSERGVPAYLRSAYLWIFVFRRERQASHRYELVGWDTVLGRPAVGIRFEPVAPYRERVNDWFGTAWVDRETAELLRVEARTPENQREWERLERHRAGEAVTGWIYVVEQVTTEFDQVHRGLRLPGRVELDRRGYDLSRDPTGWKESRRARLWVEQRYDDYRFFEVESTATGAAAP